MIFEIRKKMIKILKGLKYFLGEKFTKSWQVILTTLITGNMFKPLILFILRREIKKMGEQFIINTLMPLILSKVKDTDYVRNFLIGIGQDIAQKIPGEKIEPELAEMMDLIKEGMVS